MERKKGRQGNREKGERVGRKDRRMIGKEQTPGNPVFYFYFCP